MRISRHDHTLYVSHDIPRPFLLGYVPSDSWPKGHCPCLSNSNKSRHIVILCSKYIVMFAYVRSVLAEFTYFTAYPPSPLLKIPKLPKSWWYRCPFWLVESLFFHSSYTKPLNSPSSRCSCFSTTALLIEPFASKQSSLRPQTNEGLPLSTRKNEFYHHKRGYSLPPQPAWPRFLPVATLHVILGVVPTQKVEAHRIEAHLASKGGRKHNGWLGNIDFTQKNSGNIGGFKQRQVIHGGI